MYAYTYQVALVQAFVYKIIFRWIPDSKKFLID